MAVIIVKYKQTVMSAAADSDSVSAAMELDCQLLEAWKHQFECERKTIARAAKDDVMFSEVIQRFIDAATALVDKASTKTQEQSMEMQYLVELLLIHRARPLTRQEAAAARQPVGHVEHLTREELKASSKELREWIVAMLNRHDKMMASRLPDTDAWLEQHVAQLE